MAADSQGRVSAPSPTSGRLIYAVGDIHGRLDLFEVLVGQIIADSLAAAPASRPLLILLGDYVDHGLDSAPVISLILRIRDSGGFELRALKGDHEAALLAFIDDPSSGEAWEALGGAQTLASYGLAIPEDIEPSEWETLRDDLVQAMGAEHLRFLQALELSVEIGGYLFVHAGISPGRNLEQQTETDLLSIGADFLTSRQPLAKVVVHGHTIEAQVHVGLHRIGIDTGAYQTGVLTAVRLEDARCAFIQAVISA